MDRENKDTNAKLPKPVMKLYTEMWNSHYVDRYFSSCQAKELMDNLESVLANEHLSVSRVGRTSWKLYHKLVFSFLAYFYFKQPILADLGRWLHTYMM